MIALLLATLPFVDAFWARDLGALARELAEDPDGGEERMLFEDLLELATCAPLSALAQPSPMRELVRLEEARRLAPGTIWDDLSSKDFFARRPWNPDPRSLLRWPDEVERWTGETVLVPEPAWNCAGAPRGPGPLALLRPALLRSLPAEVASRVAYERAVLRYRQGALEEIAGIDPALLPEELRSPARFLRLEAGIDPPEGFIALARRWTRPAIVMRAAQRLYDTGRLAELADLTAADLPPSLMHRHVLVLRALSLHTLGRSQQMLEALSAAFAEPGPEEGMEPLRALAIQALARQAFDARALARFARPLDSALEQLARQALAAGNLDTARAAARRLADEPDPRWRAEGLALAGEAAFRAGDLQGTGTAFAHIFDPAQKLAGGRDPAALELAQALVVAQADRRDAGGARALADQLDALRSRVHLKAVAQLDALRVAVRETPIERGEQPLALGEVTIGLAPAPPPAPKIEIELPEARSLLAIPAPDGSLRAWFEAGGPP